MNRSKTESEQKQDQDLFGTGNKSDTQLFLHGSARHPSKRPQAKDC